MFYSRIRIVLTLEINKEFSKLIMNILLTHPISLWQIYQRIAYLITKENRVTREVRSQKLVHFVNIARVCEAREIVLGVASSSPRAQGISRELIHTSMPNRGRSYNNF